MDDIRLGVVRGISFGLFGPPDPFVPAARALGARLVRTYIFWSQVEPEPGRYTWNTVDALLNQLDGDEEVWLTVCASSPWATRQATTFLPPSPPKNLETYGRFIGALVERCRGRIRYWQCDNEPSNDGLWAGTADEYVALLRTFHAAVREHDPAALVVLGGCGYDAFTTEPARRFFEQIAGDGQDAYDIFDVHLYGRPERIPEYLATARKLANGKPILAGEHGGPMFFEFGEAEAALQQAFGGSMKELYAKMAELPPTLQMLMDGCPPELEARRHRINRRQLIVRTVLALAGGVRRMAYWDLAPEIPNYHDPYQLAYLLSGKLNLLEYADGTLSRRRPAAETFAWLAEQLAGVTSVAAVPVDGPETLRAYRADRPDGPLWIIWDERDWFAGEDQPPVEAALHNGELKLSVAADPVLVLSPDGPR